MSLSLGWRLNRYAWTPLPMPGKVIARVHDLARHNPAGGGIGFGWQNGMEIDDIMDNEDGLHDEDYNPNSEDSNEASDPSNSDKQ